jgi:hypothetical protein
MAWSIAQRHGIPQRHSIPQRHGIPRRHGIPHGTVSRSGTVRYELVIDAPIFFLLCPELADGTRRRAAQAAV